MKVKYMFLLPSLKALEWFARQNTNAWAELLLAVVFPTSGWTPVWSSEMPHRSSSYGLIADHHSEFGPTLHLSRKEAPIDSPTNQSNSIRVQSLSDADNVTSIQITWTDPVVPVFRPVEAPRFKIDFYACSAVWPCYNSSRAWSAYSRL